MTEIINSKRVHTHWKGCIYKEMHNHGRKSSGSQDGNRSSMRLVKGVGMQKQYGYRWVAEIRVHNQRLRCRSYSYDKVCDWLEEMRAKYNG